MTRFWITLDQGINFVLSSLEMMEGGEVFIPKIPSMNITDMVKALAPGIPTQIIGIRPGEKLHEIMITQDDARNTIEYDDRYVILPSFQYGAEQNLNRVSAKPVVEDFYYSSDTNIEWLSQKALIDVC
jgi:UDP-N-acetylglucosamine 4,6-dehydratase